MLNETQRSIIWQGPMVLVRFCTSSVNSHLALYSGQYAKLTASHLSCMTLLLMLCSFCRRPKSYVDRMQTLQGPQHSLRKRRMGDGAAQHAESTEQSPVLQHSLRGSHVSGPEQLRASLARLEQLEERELRRPQAQEAGPGSGAASELGEAASSFAGSKGGLHADVQDSCPQGAEQASAHLPAMPAETCSGVSIDSHSSAAGTASEPSYGRPPECDISRLPWAQGRPADPGHAGTPGEGMTDAQKGGRSQRIPDASHDGQLLNAERQTQLQ